MIIYQLKNGYCYNSDTYCLINFIVLSLAKYKNIKGELLDIGSGSGILGMIIKKEFNKLNLNACEIQKDFAFLTKKNTFINKIDLILYNNSFLDINFDKKFDLVISNPPFYPASVVQTTNENIKIARYNDNLPLDKFIQNTAKILNDNGKFFFCYDVKLLNDIILLLRQNRLNIESIQFLHPTVAKNATLVMIFTKKNSKSLMQIKEPIIMFENGKISKKMSNIYKKYDTHSIKVEL